MIISDVLRTKGHNVVRIHPTDSVELAVRKMAEHRIGALVVEDRWMKPVGIFSERDFINAVARDGAAVLSFQVQQLMSAPMLTCRSSDRLDAVLATMTIARIRHLPVIEVNELKGIVSIGDLVKHRLDEKTLEASVLRDISRMRLRQHLHAVARQQLLADLVEPVWAERSGQSCDKPAQNVPSQAPDRSLSKRAGDKNNRRSSQPRQL